MEFLSGVLQIGHAAHIGHSALHVSVQHSEIHPTPSMETCLPHCSMIVWSDGVVSYEQGTSGGCAPPRVLAGYPPGAKQAFPSQHGNAIPWSICSILQVGTSGAPLDQRAQAL